MSIPKPVGQPPAAKRRRTNTPASYGAATPTKGGKSAPQPALGFDPHSMVRHMWESLRKSPEAKFFSAADWQRAKWELWYANQLFMGERQLTPVAWQAVQHGLNELLISPADKRRAGIELEPTTDDDEEAAVAQMAAYRDQLTG